MICMGGAAGLAVATFPVARRGHREPEVRRKLRLRQAQALAQAGHIYRLRLVRLGFPGFVFGRELAVGFGVGNGLAGALLDVVERFCHGEAVIQWIASRVLRPLNKTMTTDCPLALKLPGCFGQRRRWRLSCAFCGLVGCTCSICSRSKAWIAKRAWSATLVRTVRSRRVGAPRA